MRPSNKISVLCLVHDPNSFLVKIRLLIPLTKWADMFEGAVKVLSYYDHKHSDISHANIIIFQRDASSYICNLAEDLKKNGKKVVFEIDDLLTKVPEFLPNQAKLIYPMVPYINKMLEIADAVSVTNGMLAKELGVDKSKAAITPNYSVKTNKFASHFKTSPNKITLLFASSDNVLVDVLINPLKTLQEKYQLNLVIIGPWGDYFEEQGLIISKIKKLDHESFKSFVAAHDNGIGLIPLDNSTFSSCKSPIKFFDYSNCGIPSICSNVHPYNAVIRNNIDGLLIQNKASSWFNAIEKLVLSHDLRIKFSVNARKKVIENHSLEESAKSWNKLFRSFDLTKTKNIFKNKLSKKNPFRILEIIGNNFLQPTSYLYLYRTYINHGIVGLFRRIFRR